MAVSVAGIFANALSPLKNTIGRLNLGYTPAATFLQTRNYAARKGTREKARQKKIKAAAKKVGMKDKLKKDTTLTLSQVRPDDSTKPDLPADDVWIGKYYKWKVYPFDEAIQCFKETHSMGFLDAPNAFIKAVIELDMTGPKPSKPVTKFSRIVSTPNPFDHGQSRSVIAFCKTPEMQEEAKEAGASIVGGKELISRIQSGEVRMTDYEFAVAHPTMMAELTIIKGLMKRKFPTPSAGSLGVDLPGMIAKFLHGIKYNGHPHERQQLYGIAEAAFGRVNMDAQKLEENLAAVLRDINGIRPKRPGSFITRVRLTCPPSKEFLHINHELYVAEGTNDNEDFDDDGEEDVEPAAAAAEN